MILIVAPETDAIAAIPAARGWSHRVAADVAGAALPDVAICPPDAARRLRAAHARLPLVVVAPAAWIAAHDRQACDIDADDVVDRARLDRDLPAALADWLHAERLAVLARLATAFGAANVATLTGGLRGLLVTALAERDDDALAGQAHRIAGLAGTLGFARLGRQWLRVADAERPITLATRRATDHAILTIDLAVDSETFTDF
jgi:hypothetical protein